MLFIVATAVPHNVGEQVNATLTCVDAKDSGDACTLVAQQRGVDSAALWAIDLGSAVGETVTATKVWAVSATPLAPPLLG